MNDHRTLTYTSLQIAARHVQALAWDGDELVDVTTRRRLYLDGTVSQSKIAIGYTFDRGICLRNAGACWTIAYDNRGTKALLFKDDEIYRQLNRDYYFAQMYDYPIALTKTSAGRVVIVHCPRSYDELEFEDAESGEILDIRKSSKMEFHSRLAISPSGDSFVSAGWFWHPLNGAWLFSASDITGVPRECAVDFEIGFGAEVDSVAFLGDDLLAVSTSGQVIDEEVPANGLGPMKLGLWSIVNGNWASVVDLRETCGTMMPWRGWVISFHDHPKAIDLATGEIVHRWKDLFSGRQVGCIELGNPAPPLLALDAVGGRFAVSGPNGVTVITLNSQP